MWCVQSLTVCVAAELQTSAVCRKVPKLRLCSPRDCQIIQHLNVTTHILTFRRTATCGVYNGIVYCKCITYICQLCSDSHCTLGDDFMAPFWVIACLQVLDSYQCYRHLYVCEREVPYRSSNSSPHFSMIVRERWSTMGGWGHGAASITVPQNCHTAVNRSAIAGVGRLYYVGIAQTEKHLKQ